MVTDSDGVGQEAAISDSYDSTLFFFISFFHFHLYSFNRWVPVRLGNFIQQMLCVSINFNLMTYSPVNDATVGCGMFVHVLSVTIWLHYPFWFLKGQNLLFLSQSLQHLCFSMNFRLLNIRSSWMFSSNLKHFFNGIHPLLISKKKRNWSIFHELYFVGQVVYQ